MFKLIYNQRLLLNKIRLLSITLLKIYKNVTSFIKIKKL